MKVANLGAQLGAFFFGWNRLGLRNPNAGTRKPRHNISPINSTSSEGEGGTDHQSGAWKAHGVAAGSRPTYPLIAASSCSTSMGKSSPTVRHTMSVSTRR